MESNEGRLYFGMGLDLTRLSADAQDAKSMLRGISTAAMAEGGAIDNAFSGQAIRSMADDLKKVQDSIRGFEFGSAEEKISALSAIIKENEDVILRSNEQIKQWQQQAQEAFASGDMAAFEALTQKIVEQGDSMQELILETADYAAALEAVKGISGATATGSVEPPRLYESEEDIQAVEALQSRITELNEQIRSVKQSGGDTSALQADLDVATSKLNDMLNAAAQAAAKLGHDLGSRAAEAQQNLHELNAAIAEQQTLITDLSAKVEQAKAAYEQIAASENVSAEATAQAAAQYEYFSQALQDANDRVAALQGLQVDAQTQWQSVSREVEQHDSLMVKMLGGYSNYQEILGKLPAPLQSVIGGIMGMTGAAKAFIATPLGAIIAAIVLALQALHEWFGSSVEGQMAFAKISGYVSGVLGQLKEVVFAVGKAIYKAFSNPKEAVKSLWEFIKTNLLNRIKAIANMFGDLGKLIKAALKLEWDDVSASLKAIGNDFLQATTGVENLTEKVADWTEEVHNAAKATSEIAVSNKQLEIDAAEWQKRNAELDKQKAQAQAKIYDSSLSAAERKKAMEEYKRLIKEQTDKELELQQRRIDLKARSNALTSSTIEDENALRSLEAGYRRIEAQQEQQLASTKRREGMLNRAGNAAGNAAESRAATAASAAMGISAYERDVLRKQRELGFQMEQARIDGMDEGLEKALALNKLNWDKLMADNEQRAEEYTKQYREKLMLDYLAKNPGASKAEQTKYKQFLETEISAADLPQQIKDMLKQYEDMATEAFNRSNENALQNALQGIQTYTQQRLEVEKKFKEQEEALYDHDKDGNRTGLKNGVTQGNIDELHRQRDETLEAVDEQFAAREEEYKRWCDSLANLSLEQLEDTLSKAEQELDALKDSGKATDQQLATASAKVAKARKAVDKAKKDNNTNPGKRTIKEWEVLYKTLGEVEKEFESIGDTVGGVVGDIVKECGRVATSSLSMINGIVQLANWSATATKMAAEGASKSIQTLEKASVILTIISAAMQIATQIASLFNSDNKRQKEIDALQERIDQLQWELDNAETLRSQRFALGGRYIDQVRVSLAAARGELARGAAETKDWLGWLNAVYAKASKNDDLLRRGADKAAQAYANMAYTADKAFGDARYESSMDQLRNIAQQQILIQEQLDAERSKKKGDSAKIKEWEQKIEELGQQALEVINDMVEEIIGDSASGIAEELADAFFEAFAAGEDAAKAWGDKVNDIVGDILKRIMVQRFLEQPLGDIFDRYKDKWFPNGQFAGLEAVQSSMQEFAGDLNDQFAAFREAMDAMPGELKQYFIDSSDDERAASQGGIAQASQDSVDELNGRATAIQGHTFSISENTKTLVSNTSAILASVMNIEGHTGDMARQMADMRSDMRQMRSAISDIQLKGLRLSH